MELPRRNGTQASLELVVWILELATFQLYSSADDQPVVSADPVRNRSRSWFCRFDRRRRWPNHAASPFEFGDGTSGSPRDEQIAGKLRFGQRIVALCQGQGCCFE